MELKYVGAGVLAHFCRSSLRAMYARVLPDTSCGNNKQNPPSVVRSFSEQGQPKTVLIRTHRCCLLVLTALSLPCCIFPPPALPPQQRKGELYAPGASRLACQIKVSKDIDGITVFIPDGPPVG